jgi:hypothetical protein
MTWTIDIDTEVSLWKYDWGSFTVLRDEKKPMVGFE